MVLYGIRTYKIINEDLECIDCRLKENQVIFRIQSTKQQVICPYCNNGSFLFGE